MVTYYAVNAGGNWSTAATWSTIAAKDASRVGGAVVPSNTSDCILDDYSGNVTVSATSSCKTCDCVVNGNYTGTLTFNAQLNCSGNVTFSTTMNLTSGTAGGLAFAASGTLTQNGKSIPTYLVITGGSATLTLTENLNVEKALAFSTTAPTIAGNFNITCDKLIMYYSATQVLKIPDGKTLTVTTSIQSSGAGSGGTYGAHTISSTTPSTTSYIIYNGTSANQYISNTAFTDIDASGGNSIYSYQSGTLTRTSNIFTFNPPITTVGFIG